VTQEKTYQNEKPPFYVSFKLFVSPINAQWAIVRAAKLFALFKELGRQGREGI